MIKIDQIVSVRGVQVRIIGIDSDPACLVHGVIFNDPDTRVTFFRDEIGR
jgi:predicted secreted protein